MKVIFEKKDIFSCFLLMVYAVISGILLIISSNIIVDMIAFIILVFGAMSIVKFDIAHPYVWFSFVFMIYSISYPILYLNGETYDVYTYTSSLMYAQWLALLSFLAAVGPSKIDYWKLQKIKTKVISNRIFSVLITLILTGAVFEFATGGYTHKGDIYSESSFVAFIVFRAALIYLLLYAINLTNSALRNNKLNYKESILTFSVIFLLVFFSGERDLLIRFFVILLFIYYIIVEKSKITKEIILLGSTGLALIPILAKYKYFGLTGEKTQSNVNFMLTFLQSDFGSASKNLQILLLDDRAKAFFKGKTFISSIIRSFNLEKLFNMEMISSGGWYNDRYFAAGRAGQGFTLVGDGYVNFGYLGIVVLFISIGFLIKIIYINSNKGVYSFVFYILSIPIFMYSIRADLANIISPLIKQNLLVLVTLNIALKLLYKSQNS